MTKAETLPKYLEEPEVDRLLATPYADAVRDRLLLQFLVTTGVRRTEAAKLEVRDLKDGNFSALIHGKGAKERYVPLAPELYGDVKRYVEDQRLRPGDRVFGLETGKAVNDLVKKYALAANIWVYWVDRKGGEHDHSGPGLTKKTRVTAHVTRHTFAVHSILAGRDLRTLQKDLGHADITRTVIYLEVAVKARVEVHRRFPLKWDGHLRRG